MNFQTIFNDVFKQCLKDAEQFYVQGLKTLIVDDFTIQLVSQMTTQTYLAYKEIALTQHISKVGSMSSTPHSSAIVFVAPNSENIQLLCDVLKQPKQKFAHMYINLTQNVAEWQIQQLAQADIHKIVNSVKIHFLSYKPILPNLCLVENNQKGQSTTNQSFVQNIVNLLLSIGDQPWSIRYQNGSDTTRNLSYDLQREITANQAIFLKLQQQQQRSSQKLKKVPIEVIFIDQALNQQDAMQNGVSFIQLVQDKYKLIENNGVVKIKDKQVSFSYFNLAPQTQSGLMSDCYQVQKLFEDIKQRQQELRQTTNLSIDEQIKRLDAHKEQQQQSNEIYGFATFVNQNMQLITYNFILATMQRKLIDTDVFDVQQLQAAKNIIENRYSEKIEERVEIAKLFSLGLVLIIQLINASQKMNNKKKQTAYDAIGTFQTFLLQYCNQNSEIQTIIDKSKQLINKTISKTFNWSQIESDAKIAASLFQQNNIGKQFVSDFQMLPKSEHSPPPLRWNVLNVLQASLQSKLSRDLFPVIEQLQNSYLQLEQSGQVPIVLLCSHNGFTLNEVTETFLWEQDGAFCKAVQQRGIFVTNKINSPQDSVLKLMESVV